jgi:hypothetical protein
MATTKNTSKAKPAAKKTAARKTAAKTASKPSSTEPDQDGMVWSEEHGQMVPWNSMRARTAQLTNTDGTTP